MDFLELHNINVDDDIDSDNEDIIIRAPKRYIRDIQDPFDFYSDVKFKKRYRFEKNSIMFGILPLIEPNLSKINNRGLPIPPVFQLLICLRFYATASFQLILGDTMTISQPTISRIVFRDLVRELLEYLVLMEQFDCTHIRLVHTRFQNVDEIYRNRKGIITFRVGHET
ncbi:PREDICTED: uncharacterized protein LOC107071481 isoform X1 [Polistes dominula]|uniref:Uncharacterized protein LOC107071481 isoform X1 n=1 Tax=Polistes dominula TaxID=743375 RepID=A0ABM1J0L2_POLDO|nr:PREDICTED: uncharacterized protein LOC107071481 isoform X1 [Polistes dominula]